MILDCTVKGKNSKPDHDKSASHAKLILLSLPQGQGFPNRINENALNIALAGRDARTTLHSLYYF